LQLLVGVGRVGVGLTVGIAVSADDAKNRETDIIRTTPALWYIADQGIAGMIIDTTTSTIYDEALTVPTESRV